MNKLPKVEFKEIKSKFQTPFEKFKGVAINPANYDWLRAEYVSFENLLTQLRWIKIIPDSKGIRLVNQIRQEFDSLDFEFQQVLYPKSVEHALNSQQFSDESLFKALGVEEE